MVLSATHIPNQTRERDKMGKSAKSSRKGKKAWRANISTQDIEDYYEKSTKDALSGGSLTQVPSESLFFVDKSTGSKTASPIHMRFSIN